MITARCIRCRQATPFVDVREASVILKKSQPPETKKLGSCRRCGQTQFLLHDVQEQLPGERHLRLVPSIITAVPRNRTEWLSWRMKGIGGSDAPAIMRESHWDTPTDIWLRKTRRMGPKPITYPMRRGIKLEPEARTIYEELRQREMPKRCLQRTDFEFARGSYDGLEPKQCRDGLEVKCPGREDHELALKGKIPDKYYWQCVHLFWVGELATLDYMSYNPRFPIGSRVAIVPFKPDFDVQKTLIKAETAFWEYVVNDEPPPEPTRRSAPGSNIFKIRRNRHG